MSFLDRFGVRPALCAMVLVASAGSLAQADPLAARRGEFKAALEQAERGPVSEFPRLRARFADHPLAAWLEHAHLRRRIGPDARAEIEAFLHRHAGQPVAETLRSFWLGHLAGRQDWPAFLAAYRGGDNLELRCAHVLARMRTGSLDERWFGEVESLWLHGRSLPNRCDLPFAEFAARGRLDDDLRRRRIALAAEAAQPSLMRFVARGLNEAERSLVERHARFLEAPSLDARDWPRDDGNGRRIVVLGLTRLAARDPDRAESLLDTLSPALRLSEAETGAVRYRIALWSAAGYRPEAARRLAAVPAVEYDRDLHRWRLREALARGDDAAALAAVAAVPAEQRADGARWDYFEARLRERAGEHDAARALYTRAARVADFHGFLAADRLELPYALCPRDADRDPVLRERMRARPGLVRALELFRLRRPEWAEREWRALLPELDSAERIEAVRQARAAGWHDRVLSGLGQEPGELSYYRLRFPLPFAGLVREQAERNALDPAWLAALIRAESVWMRQARSSADARGLMQLLPGTGRETAGKLGLPWPGSEALYRPGLNITLGSAYLRAQIDRFDGRPHLAIAAYNAGPAPVERWRRQRPELDTDFFIETIPFGETRDYVARVLAFSVVYDWRLHGHAVPLTRRLAGAGPTRPERAIVCPAPISESAP